MRQLRIILLVLFGFGVVSCHTPASSLQEDAKQSTMRIIYTDQNNNQYSISSSEIRYVSIKASESSSGNYDGGEPFTISITETQFSEIKNLAEAVFEAKASHTTKRQMMTSIVSLTFNGETKRVTLTRSSERTALETYLKALKK